MSDTMRIKITPDDKMVEIPINRMTHYENRIELGIMLNAHTLARTEAESEELAEEVVNELVKILKDRIMYDDSAPYGVEITNWAVNVHETVISKEDE